MKQHLLRAGSVALLSAGSACLLALSSSAQIDQASKISMEDYGIQLLLGNSDMFGHSCTSPGDVNGDGIPDLVVGSPRDDDGGNDRGAVRLLFLNRAGVPTFGQVISDSLGSFNGTFLDVYLFGTAVAGIPDIDADGVPDLAVGIPGCDDGGATDSGGIYVFYLQANGSAKPSGHKKISNGVSGFALGDLSEDDEFGSAIAAMGDLDNDGVTDLVVGAPGDDDGLDSENGALWFLFMNSDNTVKSTSKVSNAGGGMPNQIPGYSNFGSAVANIGDLNGDGVPDLAVGAPRDDDGGFNRGAVWIVFLNSTGFAGSWQKISDTQGGFTGGLQDNDLFGSSIAAIGDMDEDGIVDLAVGEPGSDDAGASSGGFWILYLNSNGTVKDSAAIRSSEPPFAGEVDPLDFLGISLAAIPDFNGDGKTDLAAGAFGDDDGGFDKGAVYTMRLLAEPIFASAVVRNGSGVNPSTYTPVNTPVMGGTWVAEVDTSAHATAQVFTFLYVYDRPNDGFTLKWGEVLLGVTNGNLLLTDVEISLNDLSTHTLAIPFDLSFEGMEVYTQMMTYGLTPELNNAIDLTLGLQ